MDSKENPYSYIRWNLKARIKFSTGKGSMVGVCATSCGWHVHVWRVCPSSLGKSLELKERIRHWLKWELSCTGQKQTEGSGGSCAWDRQRQRKTKVLLALAGQYKSFCFVLPEDFAWIRNQIITTFQNPAKWKSPNCKLSEVNNFFRVIRKNNLKCISKEYQRISSNHQWLYVPFNSP